MYIDNNSNNYSSNNNSLFDNYILRLLFELNYQKRKNQNQILIYINKDMSVQWKNFQK